MPKIKVRTRDQKVYEKIGLNKPRIVKIHYDTSGQKMISNNASFGLFKPKIFKTF